MINMNNDSSYSAIRLKYSIIINYTSYIYRLLTSIIFSTIVIRKLPISEYGVFSLVFAFYGLFTPVTQLWNFWMYRNYARNTNIDIQTTSVFLNIIFTIISSVLFFFLALTISRDIFISLIASMNLVVVIINTMLSLFITARKPYLLGYTIFVSETVRASSAYLLIYLYRLRLLGAFLAVLVTNVTILVTYLFFVYWHGINLPRPGFKIKAVKAIISNMYISLTSILQQQLQISGERVITFFTTGNINLPAYLGISYIPRRILGGISTATHKSVSPKLLRKISPLDAEDSLRVTIILSVYMSGLMIIYAKTIVSFFNPKYLNIWMIFALYTIAFTLDIFRSLFSTFSTAAFREDIKNSGMRLAKSPLFLNPLTLFVGETARLLIAVLAFVASIYVFKIKDIFMILSPFPLSRIFELSIIVWIFYKRSKKYIQYKFPKHELLASIVGITTVYFYALANGYLNLIIFSIQKQILDLGIIFINSSIIYLLITALLSKWTRRNIKNIIYKII